MQYLPSLGIVVVVASFAPRTNAMLVALHGSRLERIDRKLGAGR